MSERNTRRSLWHLEHNQSEIRTDSITNNGSKSVVFHTLYSLVSLGTERLVANGAVPETIASEMRVPGMEGAFSLPVKYGYSLCGYVGDQSDQLYHLMHPHQTLCFVDKDQLTPVPHSVPAPRATLVSNMETAVNALWDGSPQLGERCLVVGFGLIGALVSHLVDKESGAHVLVKERNKYRRSIASDLGYPVWEGEGDSFDLVYNATGHSDTWNDIFPHTMPESRLIELSWNGSNPVQLDLGGAFHTNRLRIQSSQVSRIPSRMASRWDVQRRKRLVLDLLEDPVLDRLLTHVIPFDEAPALFDEIREGTAEGLGYILTY